MFIIIGSDASIYNMIGNDSLINLAFDQEGDIQCPLFLIDRYNNKFTQLPRSLSMEEESMWICSNASCKQQNSIQLQRCSSCLSHKSIPSTHVVFLLHGFRVGF